jgi:hypothetical protein
LVDLQDALLPCEQRPVFALLLSFFGPVFAAPLPVGAAVDLCFRGRSHVHLVSGWMGVWACVVAAIVIVIEGREGGEGREPKEGEMKGIWLANGRESKERQ